MVPGTFRKIIEDALHAVDPVRLVKDNLRIDGHRLFIKDKLFDLNRFEKIHVIGVGKGAPFLFKGVEAVMKDRIHGGIVVSLPAHAFNHNRVVSMPGSHPIPDRSSLAAGQAVVTYIADRVGNHDLVLFLITGGASALMVLPEQGLELEDKMTVNKLLLGCGADINEINCVRKAMSALKGGKLARMIHPSRTISLILSDVVDSPLANIGSGPSIVGNGSVYDAYHVLKKYRLRQRLSERTLQYFNSRMEEEAGSPPLSQSHPGLEGDVHFLLADNRIALEAARSSAIEAGLETHILTSRDKGEASEAAKLYGAILKEIIYTRTPFTPPVLLLCGGELTVTLDVSEPPGKGGRNTAFVLHLLQELAVISNPFYIASIGTDGIDGPTDAAGAWIDHKSMGKAKEVSLNPQRFLDTFDSYTFFQRMGQLIKTGPTRTNVMDLRMFFIDKR